MGKICENIQNIWDFYADLEGRNQFVDGTIMKYWSFGNQTWLAGKVLNMV